MVLAETIAVVGCEINTNHIRLKKDGVVTGSGAPLRVGRSTQISEVGVVDEKGRAIRLSRCTRAVVPRLAGSSADSFADSLL